jgi:hypothetical protein
VITIFLFQRAITILFYRSIAKPATKKFKKFNLILSNAVYPDCEIFKIGKKCVFSVTPVNTLKTPFDFAQDRREIGYKRIIRAIGAL